MAKKSKKKNQEVLPEGMSRRQAKLAARAAERAALDKEPRPFAGLASESQLVALQEFVPSATAQLSIVPAANPEQRRVSVVTVLPGASAALVREDGHALVALQVKERTHNPGRDFAFALQWALTAPAGASLQSTAAVGEVPALTELIDPAAVLDIEVYEDFQWWVPADTPLDPALASSLESAAATVVPSVPVGRDIRGTAFWAYSGSDKAYIRWIRPAEDETAFLHALARVHAAGQLHLGEGTKFAGVFRTHGLIAPVFDLQPGPAAESYEAELARVDAALEEQYGNDAELSAEERRKLENLKSRQVTLR